MTLKSERSDIRNAMLYAPMASTHATPNEAASRISVCFLASSQLPTLSIATTWGEQPSAFWA
jgi:hypothetical protein